MNQLHYIQLGILKKLLFATELRYSDLRPFETLENNQLSFHIDQLMKDLLIEKVDNNYRLTLKGKEYANRMDTDTTQIKQQAKISIVNCCIRYIGNEPELLIYTRLKQPFYGCQGFPTGKVAYGESIVDASKRELMEETSLTGDLELFLIRHYRVYAKGDNRLLEDKFFYFCRYTDPAGEIHANNEGTFEWVKEKDLQTYLTKPFDDLKTSDDIFKILISKEKTPLKFDESNHITDQF